MNEEKNSLNAVEADANAVLPDLEDASRISWLTENLLKDPLKVISTFGRISTFSLLLNIILVNIVCLLAYGVIVGSFSGGIQWYMSPAKIITGLLLTILFCYPSFYIFICLSGIDVKPGRAFLILASSVSVFSILIVGFAPIAWVFSQSTSTVFFIGFFHLVFWFISTVFGMRVLIKMVSSLKCRNMSYPLFWILIFMITSLQMMTALRPMVGTADTILPKEKMFFMYNWGKLFSETVDVDGPRR
ncbi:MAG TPA: hypothetical protein DET40_01375 [Lentisphaeria bacterium]|nr:MAG: hypothetical protein A2X45_09375 [Lentisphaerae bacterium GWF2_50_93]HCE42183.1 hypothetical protein [Lentisphaeria bacterium]